MSEIKKETTEIRPDNRTLESKFYIEKAADAIRPSGSAYIGSMCLHVYKNTFSAETSFTFGTQFVGEVSEGLAIEAAKELKEQMMKRYGHEIKKRR